MDEIRIFILQVSIYSLDLMCQTFMMWKIHTVPVYSKKTKYSSAQILFIIFYVLSYGRVYIIYNLLVK